MNAWRWLLSYNYPAFCLGWWFVAGAIVCINACSGKTRINHTNKIRPWGFKWSDNKHKTLHGISTWFHSAFQLNSLHPTRILENVVSRINQTMNTLSENQVDGICAGFEVRTTKNVAQANGKSFPRQRMWTNKLSIKLVWPLSVNGESPRHNQLET